MADINISLETLTKASNVLMRSINTFEQNQKDFEKKIEKLTDSSKLDQKLSEILSSLYGISDKFDVTEENLTRIVNHQQKNSKIDTVELLLKEKKNEEDELSIQQETLEQIKSQRDDIKRSLKDIDDKLSHTTEYLRTLQEKIKISPFFDPVTGKLITDYYRVARKSISTQLIAENGILGKTIKLISSARKGFGKDENGIKGGIKGMFKGIAASIGADIHTSLLNSNSTFGKLFGAGISAIRVKGASKREETRQSDIDKNADEKLERIRTKSSEELKNLNEIISNIQKRLELLNDTELKDLSDEDIEKKIIQLENNNKSIRLFGGNKQYIENNEANIQRYNNILIARKSEFEDRRLLSGYQEQRDKKRNQFEEEETIVQKERENQKNKSRIRHAQEITNAIYGGMRNEDTSITMARGAHPTYAPLDDESIKAYSEMSELNSDIKRRQWQQTTSVYSETIKRLDKEYEEQEKVVGGIAIKIKSLNDAYSEHLKFLDSIKDTIREVSRYADSSGTQHQQTVHTELDKAKTFDELVTTSTQAKATIDKLQKLKKDLSEAQAKLNNETDVDKQSQLKTDVDRLQQAIENIENTPKLAEGGVATKPTSAIIGEGGEPEAVVPFSKIGSFFDKLFGRNQTSAEFEAQEQRDKDTAELRENTETIVDYLTEERDEKKREKSKKKGKGLFDLLKGGISGLIGNIFGGLPGIGSLFKFIAPTMFSALGGLASTIAPFIAPILTAAVMAWGGKKLLEWLFGPPEKDPATGKPVPKSQAEASKREMSNFNDIARQAESEGKYFSQALVDVTDKDGKPTGKKKGLNFEAFMSNSFIAQDKNMTSNYASDKDYQTAYNNWASTSDVKAAILFFDLLVKKCGSSDKAFKIFSALKNISGAPFDNFVINGGLRQLVDDAIQNGKDIRTDEDLKRKFIIKANELISQKIINSGNGFGTEIEKNLKSIGIDKKEVELAEGGIIQQETPAVVGEAGPEAVLPLDELYEREDKKEVNAIIREQEESKKMDNRFTPVTEMSKKAMEFFEGASDILKTLKEDVSSIVLKLLDDESGLGKGGGSGPGKGGNVASVPDNANNGMNMEGAYDPGKQHATFNQSGGFENAKPNSALLNGQQFDKSSTWSFAGKGGNSGGKVNDEVKSAIMDAAAKYGINPSLMASMANSEAGLKAGAINREKPGDPDSAMGLFQFIGSTRRGLEKQNPGMISKTADWLDPRINAEIAAKEMAKNARTLQNKGHDVNAANMYAMWHMGPVAAKMLDYAKEHPNASAEEVIKKVQGEKHWNSMMKYESNRRLVAGKSISEYFEGMGQKMRENEVRIGDWSLNGNGAAPSGESMQQVPSQVPNGVAVEAQPAQGNMQQVPAGQPSSTAIPPQNLNQEPTSSGGMSPGRGNALYNMASSFLGVRYGMEQGKSRSGYNQAAYTRFNDLKRDANGNWVAGSKSGVFGGAGTMDCSQFVSTVMTNLGYGNYVNKAGGASNAEGIRRDLMRKGFRPKSIRDLQEGDVLFSFGGAHQTKGNASHVAIAVRNPKTGQLEVAESVGGASYSGVQIKPIGRNSRWLQGGIEVYSSPANNIQQEPNANGNAAGAIQDTAGGGESSSMQSQLADTSATQNPITSGGQIQDTAQAGMNAQASAYYSSGGSGTGNVNVTNVNNSSSSGKSSGPMIAGIMDPMGWAVLQGATVH